VTKLHRPAALCVRRTINGRITAAAGTKKTEMGRIRIRAAGVPASGRRRRVASASPQDVPDSTSNARDCRNALTTRPRVHRSMVQRPTDQYGIRNAAPEPGSPSESSRGSSVLDFFSWNRFVSLPAGALIVAAVVSSP